MRLRTLASLLQSGRLPVLLGSTRAIRASHRLAFLASAARSGLLGVLADGPVPLDGVAEALAVPATMREALEAWLRFGVSLGVLAGTPAGYRLRAGLARRLARPEHDPAAALLEEAATLHQRFIAETPGRLRDGRRFSLDDVDGPLVARSSRVLEPFVREAVDGAVPARGPIRLLEVGCGSGIYIHHAAMRNGELTALGLELVPEVAEVARANVARWNLTHRVTIAVGDVRTRAPEPVYDLATLHNNINYFPVDVRIDVLRHVRAFLRPGGRLLITIACLGRGGSVDMLNLWGAMTAGCGRLPAPEELAGQIAQAGFSGVVRRSLIPGESVYSFTAVRSD